MALPGVGLLESILANAVGYGVGSAMSPALAPLVQGLANEIWQLDPDMPLPPSTAAAIALKHPGLLGAMAHEARMQGFSDERFAHFVDAADNPPGLSELLELLRRHELGQDAVVQGMHDLLIPARWHEPLLALRKVLLSPADLAMMRQQSFIDAAEQVRRSALQGVDAEDAHLLFEISGEPPGPETMVALWRRGKATEAEVRQAVVEGRLKLKWTDKILALKEVPLSASLAAEAVLRERHLPRDPHYYAAAAGISASDFDAWVDLMGRPIATGEALTLARRGQFTFAAFKEAVARSDVRTEYAEDIWKLKRALPSLFELRRLIQEGAVSDALATQIVLDHGFDPEIAKGVVQAAHGQKTKQTKDLLASQVSALYEAGFETRDWAVAALADLGYDAEHADLYLLVPEARRMIAYLHAVVARIKASYVQHRIELDEALRLLEQAGIEADERQSYTDLWEAEREANVRRLTQAQVAKLVKLGKITRDDGFARFVQMGFPDEDARLLLALIADPDAAAPSPVS